MRIRGKKVKGQENAEVMPCCWSTEPMGGSGHRDDRGHIGKIDRGDFMESLDCWLERFVLIPQIYLKAAPRILLTLFAVKISLAFFSLFFFFRKAVLF